MKVLCLLVLLPILIGAELQQEQRILNVDGQEGPPVFEEELLHDEVKRFYSGGVKKAQGGGEKKKALLKAKAQARANAQAQTQPNVTQTDDQPVPDEETDVNAPQLVPNISVVVMPDTEYGSPKYPPPSEVKQWKEFFDREAAKHDGVKNHLPSPKTQCVYLDFSNQGAPYYVDILNTLGEKVGELGPFHGHYYTHHEQERILNRLKKDFHLYNVYFVTKKPKDDHEPYTTIKFNANDFPGEFNPIRFQITTNCLFEAASVLFGLAPGIDYLNLIRDEVVRVSGYFWSFLVDIDPTGALFTKYTGIPVAGPIQLQAALSQVTINESANTASHELAHALGCRHHDAFGSPGDGLPITGQPGPNAYVAPYPGPVIADESTLHLMASSEVLGIAAFGFQDHAQDDRFFSERSSVKLSLAEGCGNFLTEKEAKKYNHEIDGLEIPQFFIQNPLEDGDNEGGRYLRIDTLNIAGRIDDKDEVDQYRLYLKEGRIFSAEVISFSSTLKDRVMTSLTLLKVESDGRRKVVAANDFTFEPFDPHIIDFFVEETGAYILAVAVQQVIPISTAGNGVFDELISVKKVGGYEFLKGDYNLLIYTHHDPMQKFHYRDEYKLCMKGKKYSHSGHSYSNSKEHSKEYSKDEYSKDDDQYSDDDHYSYSKEHSKDENSKEYSKDDDYTYDDDDSYSDAYYTDDDEYSKEHSKSDSKEHSKGDDSYSEDYLRGSAVSHEGMNKAQRWQAFWGQ